MRARGNFGRTYLGLAAVATLSLAGQSFAFTFKSPNMDIKLVFQAMAREAKINVILDKSVRGTIPVDLNNVDPVKAMHLVAGINRLKALRVDAGGDRDTYLIGDPQTVDEAARSSTANAVDTHRGHESAAGKAARPEWPIDAIHASVCGIHFYNGELVRQVVAHHYCSHLSPELLQCVIYDSNKKDARLIGVEYIVSEKVFKSLPSEEKKLWHSHAYEAKSGALMSLGMPEAEEKGLMTGLMSTYGKTWHFWQVDRGDELPLGAPQLMMGFTADGQARSEILEKRDREYGVSTDGAKKSRRDIPDVPIAAGANAWSKGDVLQLELRPVKSKARE